jgi:Golgi nucleoside diphosphatase
VFKFYEENGQDKIHVSQGKKIMPGIATFADHVQDVGGYFLPLLMHAAEMIPAEYLSRTHVFILGTAGMFPLNLCAQF